jgi:hypothetical protein
MKKFKIILKKICRGIMCVFVAVIACASFVETNAHDHRRETRNQIELVRHEPSVNHSGLPALPQELELGIDVAPVDCVAVALSVLEANQLPQEFISLLA